MATAQDILLAAFGRSRQNDVGDLATLETELLQRVNTSLIAYFAVAAARAPLFIGERVSVPDVGGTWLRPVGAEIVWAVQTPDGSPVAILPADDLTIDPQSPAIYQLGRRYYKPGRANDPSGALDFFCAMRPPAMTAMTDPLPEAWEEAYNELLVLDVAMYLATKDGRESELKRLEGEHEGWLALYVQFLGHETLAQRRRWGKPGQASIATAGAR
jgi:hypothetical protein